MKVLFLNPSRAGQKNIPANIPILLGVLKKYKHNVRLFDLSDYEIFDDKSYENIFFKNAPFNTKQIIQDRKRFYKSDFGTIVTECKLKKSDYRTDFEKLLIDFKPDIIAVSCLSIDIAFASQLLLPFKKKYKIPIIFGGIHAIILPEAVLNLEVCDFVCIGEGEKSFISLLDILEKREALEKARGIWFKKYGKIVRNPPMSLVDLGDLPAPNFEDFDPVHFYRPFDGKSYKTISYELSRGCPFNCTFCVNKVLKEKYKGLGAFHRVKRIEQSIEEIKFLKDKYNFEFVRFWDEDFTSINTEYLKGYADLYRKEVNLPFVIYACANTVTEKKLKILKKMGCKGFAMGIESGNEFIRNQIMKKKISNKIIIEKFKLVKSYGIRTSAYNLIGVPYDTRATILETIELNRRANPDSFSVTLLEPYKGIPIRKMCEEQGLDSNHEVLNCGIVQFVPRGMTREELAGLYRTFPFYIRFPKERYDEIRLAESDIQVYQKLLNEFAKLK